MTCSQTLRLPLITSITLHVIICIICWFIVLRPPQPVSRLIEVTLVELPYVERDIQQEKKKLTKPIKKKSRLIKITQKKRKVKRIIQPRMKKQKIQTKKYVVSNNIPEKVITSSEKPIPVMNNKVQHGLVAKPTTGNSISVAKTNEVATQTITTNRVPITTSVPVTLPVAKKGSSIKIVGLQRKVEYRPMFKLPVWVEESGKNLIGELKFWVLPDGSVDRVYVIKTFGYVQIDDLAVNTILRWRFEPLPEGVNREDWGIVRIKIQLE